MNENVSFWHWSLELGSTFLVAAGDAIIKVNLDISLLDWKEFCFGTTELFERPLSATLAGLPERLKDLAFCVYVLWHTAK